MAPTPGLTAFLSLGLPEFIHCLALHIGFPSPVLWHEHLVGFVENVLSGGPSVLVDVRREDAMLLFVAWLRVLKPEEEVLLMSKRLRLRQTFVPIRVGVVEVFSARARATCAWSAFRAWSAFLPFWRRRRWRWR